MNICKALDGSFLSFKHFQINIIFFLSSQAIFDKTINVKRTSH